MQASDVNVQHNPAVISGIEAGDAFPQLVYEDNQKGKGLQFSPAFPVVLSGFSMNNPGGFSPFQDFQIPAIIPPPMDEKGFREMELFKESAVNEDNFEKIIQIVKLDEHNKFHGQGSCLICNQSFGHGEEIRILNCLHCFHGKCIYAFMVKENKNHCPLCFYTYK